METVEPVPHAPTHRFFSRMNPIARGHIVAMLAEFMGTMMFLFFSYAAAQIGNEKVDTLVPALEAPGSSLLQISYISAVFGFSLGVNVWIFYRVSGGMFNPAVALGLWIAGAFNWVRMVCVIPMQFLGAIAAAGLVSAILPGDLLAENALAPGTSVTQGFFLETILTAQLVMTIIMLAVEKSRTSFIAPLGVGLALFIDHLIGINYTGTSVNPARTLGPAAINGHFVGYIWIFFVAPCLGAVIAASAYLLLKAMGYESANPGQDDDGLSTFRIVQAPIRPVAGSSIHDPEGTLYNVYFQDTSSTSQLSKQASKEQY
ncbi:aquaporin-1 [Coniella lustricola]|uniref:Aquaporin-1 n=1 Tax=Coniella lustricola TaxID=2025994 RepID=A0A2T3AGT7_9PEZI|nr:aquaporin-1 [Coniella lustricola]